MPGWGPRGEWLVEYFNTVTDAFVSTDAFPAPDTEPFEPSIRSTMQLFQTIYGDTVGILPQTKSSPSPLDMTWTMQSGSWLKERIQNYIESGTGLRITPHTGAPLSGVFVEIRPRARAGFSDSPVYDQRNRQTLWDIRASFQPINVQSGT